MNRSVLILSAVLLLAPAAAQAADDVMIIRMSDLNLASEAGASAALRRIRSAADSFCGGRGERTLAAYRRVGECRATMVGKAVKALDAPLVTAKHTDSRDIELASR